MLFVLQGVDSFDCRSTEPQSLYRSINDARADHRQGVSKKGGRAGLSAQFLKEELVQHRQRS